MKFQPIELAYLLNAVDGVRSNDTQQAAQKGSLLLRLSAELEKVQNDVDDSNKVSDE